MVSENILSISYEPIESKLIVTFMSLGKYSYDNVPYSVYDDLLQSKKKTETFNKLVKGKYAETKIL